MSPYTLLNSPERHAAERVCPACRVLLPKSSYQVMTRRASLRTYTTCIQCRTARYTVLRRAKGLPRRVAAAASLGLPPVICCPVCRVDQPSHLFIGERDRYMPLRCMDCDNEHRKATTSATLHGQRHLMDCYTHDFHTPAQRRLFPHTAYHALTATQRHQTYILARWRWLMQGWGPLFKRDVAQDKSDLLTWATALGGPSLVILLEPYDRYDPPHCPAERSPRGPYRPRLAGVDADRTGACDHDSVPCQDALPHG